MSGDPVFVHCWLPDDIRERLGARFEVDYHDMFAEGALPPGELRARASGARGLLVIAPTPVDAGLLEATKDTLRVVANVGVGVDNVDVDAATARGILVTNTPGVLDAAVADMAMALLLAVGRRVVEADRYARAGKFQGHPFPLMWGADLEDETIGIVGMGRIGRQFARRARAFGARIVYHNRNRLPGSGEREFGAEWRALGDLLAESRYVVILCPLTPETRHLIDADAFARMREDAFLVNIARGPIVHEEALVAALRDGRIAGAALDVYEFEPRFDAALAEMENVVLTPHIGSATTTTRRAMIDLAARNLEAALGGGEPPCPVNPEASGAG